MAARRRAARCGPGLFVRNPVVYTGKMKSAILTFLLLAAAPAVAQLAGPAPDYANPELYLAQGPQSELSSATVNGMKAELGLPAGSGYIRTLSALYFWLIDDFEGTALGGSTVGKTTAEQLIKERKLGGCHDYALVYSAALRALGYPALMADTASIRWAKDYKSGSSSYSGHVFVEVYAGGKWRLADAVTGRLILDYYPLNQVIPLSLDREPKGFYVMFKGTDPETYGINSINPLNKAMAGFAEKLPGLAISYPDYEVVSFSRYAPQVLRATERQLTSPCSQSPCKGSNKSGIVMQLGGYDLHLEKTGGQYAAHLYPFHRIFNVKEDRTLTFPTLRALNDYLKELQAKN